MKRSINTLRLLLEIAATVALLEVFVFFTLPYIAPQLAGNGWLAHHLLLLGLMVTPVALWRYYEAGNHPSRQSDLAGDAIWLTTMARIASAGALCISVTVMMGWLVNWQSVCWVVYGLPTMKFNTSLGLTLLALTTFGSTAVNSRFWMRVLLTALSLMAACLGLVSLAEIFFEVNLGIDTLIVSDPMGMSQGGDPGRMFPATAVAMSLMGAGLALGRWRSRPVACWLVCVAALISAISMVWCIIEMQSAIGSIVFKTMAIHTAVAFLLIAFGTLLTEFRESPVRRQITFANLRIWGSDMWPLIVVVGSVLVVGLGLSTVAVHRTESAIRQEAWAEFHRLADRVTSEVERRANLPAYGLRGARGVYAASKSVERLEFRAYVKSRDLSVEFPGVLGFGFIERVLRSDLDAFVTAERADNAPDFQVKSAGDNPVLYVIKFIDPMEVNGAACGYDIGVDPAHRATIEKAIRTGKATISSRMKLEQGGIDGYLFITPIYRNGTNPQTADEREAALLGLAFAPITIHETFKGVMDCADGLVDIEVFDGLEMTAENLLFDADGNTIAEQKGKKHGALFDGRVFHEVRHVRVGGHEWSLGLFTTPKFEHAVDRTTPALVGAGGVLLTTLLSAVVWFLGRGRARAVLMAEEMTRELRDSEMAAHRARVEAERLAEIARRTSNAVVITDVFGKVEWVNEGFTRITGYTLEEVKGKKPGDVLQGPATDPIEATRMGEAIRRGQGSTVELVNYAKDGREYVISIEIRPLQDDCGNLTGFMAIETDISERRKVEEQVRSAAAMLSRTGAMAHVGGWELDTITNRLTWSDEVYRIHELEVGTPITVDQAVAFYSQDAQSTIAGAIEEGVATGRGWDLEMPLNTATGRQIWVRAQGEAVIHEGRTVKLFGAFQDVTEQHEAKHELAIHAVQMEQLKNAADAASRAKSEFLANMSHEIRTPLTAILGYADLLHEEGELSRAPERRVQTIDTIRNAGQHLLTVINDVLDLSKIEADKMTVESVDTPVVELLAEVESLFRSRAAGKGIGFQVSLESPVPNRIMSDPTRLRQILMNLAGNAIKFTQVGSVTIRATVVKEGAQARLRIDVEDTGPGIRADLATALFAPFSQADSTVSRQHGGTGLGLTISRRLARLLGGDVTLSWTELGKGSTFSVQIPLVPAEGAVDVERVEVPTRENKSQVTTSAPKLSGRVLLAEDGPDNQRLITFYLKKAGAEVEIAENGRIALSMLQKAEADGNPFKLLVTDMQMPEMDGYSLARTLRANGSSIAIIALTAHAMAEDRQKCMDAGCNDYASKPINSKLLIETCHAWLARQVDNAEAVST